MSAWIKVHHPARLACLGLLVLLCSFWPGESAVLAQETKTYVSQKNGFSFQYPAAYELKSIWDNSLDFRQGGKTVFSLRVDDRFIEMLYQMLRPGPVMFRQGEEDPYQRLAQETRKNPELFRRYARREAQNWCSADGPDGSVYCEEIKNEKPFTSRGCLNCLEFHPIMIREYYNLIRRKSLVGPYFAVFVPQEDRPLVLIIQPPLGVKASPGLVQEMRNIIDSLRLTP